MTNDKYSWADEPAVNWDPDTGGIEGILSFKDNKEFDLGPDPDGTRFKEIASRMIGGYYYPPDAV